MRRRRRLQCPATRWPGCGGDRCWCGTISSLLTSRARRRHPPSTDVPVVQGLGRGPFKAKTRVRIPSGTYHQRIGDQQAVASWPAAATSITSGVYAGLLVRAPLSAAYSPCSVVSALWRCRSARRWRSVRPPAPIPAIDGRRATQLPHASSLAAVLAEAYSPRHQYEIAVCGGRPLAVTEYAGSIEMKGVNLLRRSRASHHST